MNINDTDIQDWISTNKLLCFELINPEHGNDTIIGRLLKFDKTNNTLLIYVDDTKSLSNILLTNILKIN